MTPVRSGWLGVLLALAIAAGAAGPVRADTVQLSINDGRVTLVAENASPSAIFTAWSRAGGVTIVNAERLQGQPLTLRLDAVPEEQALDTLLRSVSGYLATRRTQPAGAYASVFERIVILAAPQVARDTTPQPPAQPGRPGVRTAARPAAPPAPFAAQPEPQPQPQPQPEPDAEPAGIPVGPGVVRLVGPDGQPVEDDQVGAPPPPPTPYGGSDTPQPQQNGPAGAPAPPVQNGPAPATSTPRPGMPTAPATPGASTPGMPVPAPASPQR